eukprot:SAG31_NODE_2825_length_5038_cov_2.170277_4_plen_168_part_00
MKLMHEHIHVQANEEELLVQFNEFDEDGSGSINAHELRQIIAQVEMKKRATLQQLDARLASIVDASALGHCCAIRRAIMDLPESDKVKLNTLFRADHSADQRRRQAEQKFVKSQEARVKNIHCPMCNLHPVCVAQQSRSHHTSLFLYSDLWLKLDILLDDAEWSILT